MHRSRWVSWWVGTALVSGILLIVLVSSQHRVRLIVCSFSKFDTNRSFTAKPFRYLPLSSFTSTPSFASDVAILQAFDSTHPLKAGDPLAGTSEPDTCLTRLELGYRMHCYNVDIACAMLLSGYRIPSRMWNFNGPFELGGDGHNLLEVFDGGSRRWKAIDPYYHCYFTLGDSIPVGVPELRNSLLTSPGLVHLVRYSDTLGERPDSEIVQELTYLVPGAMLHENNDFAWRYAHRYGWLTTIAAPMFDRLPLRYARGVRTIMLGSRDRLLVIEDRFSPHFPFLATKLAFYCLLVLFVISMVSLLARKRKRTRVAKYSNADRETLTRPQRERLSMPHAVVRKNHG